MRCSYCGSLQDLPDKKVSFRAVCETCGRDLHTCKNCKYYCLGKPNDCLVPGTPFIRDRESSNFCEDFFPQEKSPPSQKKGKNSFENLFND